MDKALESAAQAFAVSRRSTPAQRQPALLKIADAPEARASSPTSRCARPARSGPWCSTRRSRSA
ncbi:hypothetical protein AB0F15_09865 [Amycolatopsis sp. NPDC026612]|uniref:hypothetical protein n=1 Tax=Amycolatopsis sp. NPDC026612 TaxID=3155466 RepID=UPI0033FDDDB1